MLISDPYVGETPGACQEDFKEFTKALNFNLWKITEYQQALADLGLKITHFEDISLPYLKQSNEIQSFAEKNRDDILQEVSIEDFDATMLFWSDKIKWAEEGTYGKLLIVAENHP